MAGPGREFLRDARKRVTEKARRARRRPRPGAAVGEDEHPPAAGRIDVTFALRFVVAFVALEAAYYAIPDRLLAAVVDVALAMPASAVLASAFGIASVAQDGVLSAPGYAMAIVRGCDGSSSIFLVAAALFALRGRRDLRAAGVLSAILVLHAWNVARIVALFVLMRLDMHAFHVVHGMLAPSFAVLLACSLFVWWGRRANAAAAFPA